MAWGTKTRHERGYGAAWVRLRTRVLQRDCALCQVCRKAGRVTIATQVDHIVSKANAARMKWTAEQIDTESNCQSICDACHLIKTEAEQGKTKRATIGLDGWPVQG